MIAFPEFCNHIKDICFLYGGSVISWIRSPIRNAEKGGHTFSLHLVGLAADVVFDTEEGVSFAIQRCQQIGLSFKINGAFTLHIQALPPLMKGK